MRRIAFVLSFAVLILVACGGSNEAAPPPTVQATTPTPSPTPAAATCEPNGATIDVVAQAIEFSEECLAAPANEAFKINFENKDVAKHNVAIYADESAAEELFSGEIVGNGKITYDVPALPGGTYFFQCDVHPDAMNGTFVVA